MYAKPILNGYLFDGANIYGTQSPSVIIFWSDECWHCKDSYSHKLDLSQATHWTTCADPHTLMDSSYSGLDEVDSHWELNGYLASLGVQSKVPQERYL